MLAVPAQKATWRSGDAADCKSAHPGSIPGVASSFPMRLPLVKSPPLSPERMVGDGMKEVGKVRRRGERLLERGLRMPVEREDLADALRYLDQRFVAASPEGRAAQLAADALALYDATLKANPFIHELACTKGCAYCCYNYVSATAPEVFLIARHVRGLMPEGAVGGLMERLAPATTLAPARAGGAQNRLRISRWLILLRLCAAAHLLPGAGDRQSRLRAVRAGVRGRHPARRPDEPASPTSVRT